MVPARPGSRPAACQGAGLGVSEKPEMSGKHVRCGQVSARSGGGASRGFQGLARGLPGACQGPPNRPSNLDIPQNY